MQEILQQLRELRLSAMALHLEEQMQNPSNQNLSFEDRLELLIHAEVTAKRNRKINRLLKSSKLVSNIRLEDIEYDEKRGLKRSQFMSLLRLDFITTHQNIIITGATGCGKTYLASAIGNKACIEGYKVKFIKLPVFLEEMQLSHSTGGFLKLMQQLLQFDLLILDDFGITTINESQRHDLFTIIDDRHKIKSTIITSQLPSKSWHKYLSDPTLADAILDRILSQSARIELKGQSLRWKGQSTELCNDNNINDLTMVNNIVD